jgi:hypothetical protein
MTEQAFADRMKKAPKEGRRPGPGQHRSDRRLARQSPQSKDVDRAAYSRSRAARS